LPLALAALCEDSGPTPLIAGAGRSQDRDPRRQEGLRAELPPLITLEVHSQDDNVTACEHALSAKKLGSGEDLSDVAAGDVEELLLTSSVAARIPYLVSALSAEWRPQGTSSSSVGRKVSADMTSLARVQVFMPDGCSASVLRALIGRLAADADGAAIEQGLCLRWQPSDLMGALKLVQVASMLQIEDLMPELIELVREAATTTADFSALEAACKQLELPAALREAAALIQTKLAPVGLPEEKQVRSMIASALLTADGKVWNVVQKVINRRQAWPHLAAENAALLLAFATGAHGSIRATPHTGFFWGSRDFLYLVCRYIRSRPEHFDAMVSAMFDSLYNMDPELPSEIIDAVFKELLVHEGLSLSQCEHVIAKLMQQEGQLEYLFHEWSGVFCTLPSNARLALSKGLLPTVGRCPHSVLDFVLKELDRLPAEKVTSRWRLRPCDQRFRSAPSALQCGGRARAMARLARSTEWRWATQSLFLSRVIIVLIVAVTLQFVYARMFY